MSGRGRRLAARAVVLAAAVTGMHAAYAQGQPAASAYPTKPVRIVAATSPGGGIDITARVVAQRLSEQWNQQMVVDNRAGGGGVIATGIVAKAIPDGYTLLVNSVGVAYVNELHKGAPYDVVRDLAPVAQVASQPSLLAVHASIPASTLPELLQLVRSKPGQISFGSGGAGGASHMGTELLAHAANLKIVHVPYKGTGPSTAALLSGEVNMSLVGIATALPHVKAGRIKPIGVTGASRSALFPDVPTISEAGVPGYEFAGWYGLFAPAGTPKPIVNKLNGELNRSLQQPETLKRMTAMGFEVQTGTADEFAKYFRAEVVKWRKVIRDAGIVAN